MRISSLPSLGACPGWWLLRRREAAEGAGAGVGPAADTGSAAGRAIELYHLGHPAREAVALALEDGVVRERYPRADAARARRLSTAYMADPENPPGAAVDLEREVECALEDAAGGAFRLVGHLDQAREGRVWDLKAGVAHAGAQLLGAHALQLAGYEVAGGYDVGGIIHLAAYELGGPVRWHAPGWREADARAMLGVVRTEVAALRAGRVVVRPGPHCAWCPAGHPAACLARFRDRPPLSEEVE